jgi:hypothetical protein
MVELSGSILNLKSLTVLEALFERWQSNTLNMGVGVELFLVIIRELLTLDISHPL